MPIMSLTRGTKNQQGRKIMTRIENLVMNLVKQSLVSPIEAHALIGAVETMVQVLSENSGDAVQAEFLRKFGTRSHDALIELASYIN